MGTDPAPKRDVTDHRAPGRTGRGGWRTRPESTVAGLLLLAGLVAGVLSVVPVLEEPDFLRRLPTREGEVVSGALFQLLMVLAYAGFALVVHPVLHRASPALSLGFVSFRLVACGLHLIAIAALPLFLDLGRAFETVSATAGPAYEVLAEWTLNPEEETAGERGAFEWRVEVEPWEAQGSTADTTDAPEMDRVRVEVAWNERGRPVSVEAVELVRRDASKETP